MDFSAAGSAASCIVNGIFSGAGVLHADRLNYSPTNSAPYTISIGSCSKNNGF